MSEKFRVCTRAVAGLTSDDELLRIADLPEVPVSLETAASLTANPLCHGLPSGRQPRGDPRWRPIQAASISPWPRGEPRILDMCQGPASRSASSFQTALACSSRRQPRSCRSNTPIANTAVKPSNSRRQTVMGAEYRPSPRPATDGPGHLARGRCYAALAMSILPRLLRHGRRRLQDVAAGLAAGDLDGR
jgi:hypothetical protein